MARVAAFLFLIVAVATINAAPPQCGENEQYNTCGTSCPPTCQNPNPQVCTLACIVGCECVEGYVRNTEQKCVPTYSC